MDIRWEIVKASDIMSDPPALFRDVSSRWVFDFLASVCASERLE